MFEYATRKVCDLVGVRGKPEIRIAPGVLTPQFNKTAIPTELGKIVDIAAVNAEPRSVWILLGEDGDIFRFDASEVAVAKLASITLPTEEGQDSPFRGNIRRPRLHASHGGDFAAVVSDYGRYGAVVDLSVGNVTVTLDGGEYHPETVPFSFAFLDHGGQTIAVHRTAWNRLDLSDASNGKLLSVRNPTSYRAGEQRPEHYLDYFHGALYVSPNGTRILDDGWVWHPVGVPVVWDLNRWLSENPWESEDGPTRKKVCARDYYWDHGVIWLDEQTVAIAGLGDDDIEIIDGVRIFDITSRGSAGSGWRDDWSWAKQITSFAGPAGKFFSDGRWLYSSDKSGLSKWDTQTGTRIGYIENFRPTQHHTGTGELAELADGVLIRWKITP